MHQQNPKSHKKVPIKFSDGSEIFGQKVVHRRHKRGTKKTSSKTLTANTFLTSRYAQNLYLKKTKRANIVLKPKHSSPCSESINLSED